MLNRRNWLRSATSMGIGLGASRCLWARPVSESLTKINGPKHLIILWMAGGPSQMDTFDLKVGHANGGEYKETSTNVPGIQFSEHLPNLAKMADKLCIVRSLQTKEGDHGRGTFLVRTGQRPGAPIKYPAVPATLAKELSPNDPMVPDYVAVMPPTFINPAAFGSGFLGPRHQPLTVGAMSGIPTPGMNANTELKVDNLLPSTPIADERVDRRRRLWEMLQTSYGAASRPGAPKAHDTVTRRAMKLSDSELNVAFDLSMESDSTKAAYGEGSFGQGCLMARRLVERGVPVVEVTLGSGGLGWDTHLENFNSVKRLSQELDAGWSQMMIELDERGILQDTTILWIGEFGRTPQINAQAGRDHFPDAWSCVLAGGNIAGGQVYGKTSDDGMTVTEKPVSIQQVLATVAKSVGVDPAHENMSELGRPLKVVDGEPIDDLIS